MASQRLYPEGINKTALVISPIRNGKIEFTKYPALTYRNDFQSEILSFRIILQEKALVTNDIDNKIKTANNFIRLTCLNAANTSPASTYQIRAAKAIMLIKIPAIILVLCFVKINPAILQGLV
jgi:hypothetical protein